MAIIKCYCGKDILLDDDCLEKVLSFCKTWSCKGRGRVVATRYRPPVSISWLIVDGEVGKVLDHINRDFHDNRACNLRKATIAENGMNRPKQTNNFSGYKGVVFQPRSGHWFATIMVNQKNINLGTYITPEEAAIAYNKAARNYFGEFAYQNSI